MVDIGDQRGDGPSPGSAKVQSRYEELSLRSRSSGWVQCDGVPPATLPLSEDFSVVAAGGECRPENADWPNDAWQDNQAKPKCQYAENNGHNEESTSRFRPRSSNRTFHRAENDREQNRKPRVLRRNGDHWFAFVHFGYLPLSDKRDFKKYKLCSDGNNGLVQGALPSSLRVFVSWRFSEEM